MIKNTGSQETAGNALQAETIRRGFVLAHQDKYAVEKDEAAVRVFWQWWNGPGIELARRMMAGVPVKPDESVLAPLARAAFIWMADRTSYRLDQGMDLTTQERHDAEWALALRQKGAAVLKRMYLQHPSEPEDEQVLADYRIMLESHILGVPYNPCELDLHELPQEQQDWPTGGGLPHLRCRTLESVLRESGYSDQPSRRLDHLLRPEAVQELHNLAKGVSPHRAADGREFVKPNWAFLNGVPEEDIWDSRRLTGCRPHLIIIASAMDTFFYMVAPVAEALFRAYGDAVEFHWIHTDVWDFLIRTPATCDFLRPDAPQEIPLHAVNFWQKARQAKQLMLIHPQMGFPCLVDDPATSIQHVFKTGGGSGCCLLTDCDGTIRWRSTHSWDYWEQNRPPGFGEHLAWMREVERILRSLLEENHVPATVLGEPCLHWQTTAAPTGTVARMNMLWSRVLESDPIKRELLVRARSSTFTVLDKGPEEEEPHNPWVTLRMRVAPEARITHNNKPIPLSDIVAGSVVRAPLCFRMADGIWDIHAMEFLPDWKKTTPSSPSAVWVYGQIIRTAKDRIWFVGDKIDPRQKGFTWVQQGLHVPAQARAQHRILSHVAGREMEIVPEPVHLVGRNGAWTNLNALRAGDRLAAQVRELADNELSLLHGSVFLASSGFDQKS